MGKKSNKEKKGKSKGKNHFDFSEKKRKGRGKGKTKQDKNWDKYFKEFQDYLEPKGIYMRDVEGDGNCLFRSIADHIDGDESMHRQYRDMAVEYITKQKDYFAMFLSEDENIDEYIKDMSDNGTWGGHFELVALSHLLNVKFCLYLKENDPVIVKSGEKDLKGSKYVHLAYHVDEHYSSVRKLGDTDQAPAERISVDFDDSESDGDSTEGSDREMSSVTKEMNDMHLSKKEKKQYKKQTQEEEPDSKGKGKHQKNKDKKEEKSKNQKKKK